MFASVIELFSQGGIIDTTLFVLFPVFWLLFNQGIDFVYIINILASLSPSAILLLVSVVLWCIVLHMYISFHHNYNDHIW